MQTFGCTSGHQLVVELFATWIQTTELCLKLWTKCTSLNWQQLSFSWDNLYVLILVLLIVHWFNLPLNSARNYSMAQPKMSGGSTNKRIKLLINFCVSTQSIRNEMKNAQFSVKRTNIYDYVFLTSHKITKPHFHYGHTIIWSQ